MTRFWNTDNAMDKRKRAKSRSKIRSSGMQSSSCSTSDTRLVTVKPHKHNLIWKFRYILAVTCLSWRKPGYSENAIAQPSVFYVVRYRSLFVLLSFFLLAILLSVLPCFTASDYLPLASSNLSLITTSTHQSTQTEPPTMGKQLVNVITCGWESNAPFW
jgi:hypothetical protein